MSLTRPHSARIDPRAVIITESRPNDVLASLHESAEAEREYLFAARDADPEDLVLVAWYDDRAVGYIATTDRRADGLFIWEHLVVPAFRGRGLGERLLLEAARRAMPGAIVEVDPLGELDSERVADYYRRLGFGHEAPGGRIWATVSDVIRALSDRDASPERHVTVQELLDRKPPGVVTITPEATVRDAIPLLNEHRIGAVVVSSDGSRIEGILSERDILLGLDGQGAAFLDGTVGSVTTTDVLSATVGDSIVSAMDAMTRRRIRHLPVTATGSLVGIISVGDVVSYRLEAVEAAAFAEQAGLSDEGLAPPGDSPAVPDADAG
ncbi:MAG: GNAT family N-acetyltransferase [Acidimicrobiia bacterium]|nr:GNAT family N-acetyltransferase [Acidimicrobiia bacterium]